MTLKTRVCAWFASLISINMILGSVTIWNLHSAVSESASATEELRVLSDSLSRMVSEFKLDSRDSAVQNSKSGLSAQIPVELTSRVFHRSQALRAGNNCTALISLDDEDCKDF